MTRDLIHSEFSNDSLFLLQSVCFWLGLAGLFAEPSSGLGWASARLGCPALFSASASEDLGRGDDGPSRAHVRGSRSPPKMGGGPPSGGSDFGGSIQGP